MPDCEMTQDRNAGLLPAASCLCVALREHVGGPVPPYGVVSKRMRDGTLPVVNLRGRWHFRPADVPVIARALGLSADAEAAC